MILDRARADPEMPSRFLVGRAGGELFQHLAFAPREWFAPGKMQGRNARWRILRLPAGVSLDTDASAANTPADGDRLDRLAAIIKQSGSPRR